MSAIIVKIGLDIFAIPLSYIYRIISAEEINMEYINNKKVLNYMGRQVPIINMYGDIKADKENFVIMVKADDRILAILTDDLLEQREIVIKPLGKPLCDLKQYMGATILLNGRVALILDIGAFKDI